MIEKRVCDFMSQDVNAVNQNDETTVDVVTDLTNDVRGFMMYENLYQALSEYIRDGDGYHAISVFDEDRFPESDLIDGSIPNLAKMLSTAFGLAHTEKAIAIVSAIRRDGVRKKTLRFRSRHPIFAVGTPLFQNVCLISGMIHMEIPILPYFNGTDILVDYDENANLDLERMDVYVPKTKRKRR